MTLRVLEMFDSLQGEGRWTGAPMTFVRLAGCNAPESGLACVRWCDTPDSWRLEDGDELEIGDVLVKVTQPRICLTGGEPLLQLEGVSNLAAEARRLGLQVHLETNGTISPPRSSGGSGLGRVFDWSVLSPKPPGYSVAGGWDGLVDELKFIADDSLTATVVEELSGAYPEAAVSIQPMWGTRVHDKAISMVMGHPDWRLSLQIHKVLGIQ